MDYIMVKSMIYHLYNKQEKILAKKEAERKSTLLINEIAHLKGKKSETIKRQNEKINDTLGKNDNTFIEVIKEPDGIEYDFPLTQISPLNKNLFQLSEKTKNEQPLKNHSRYQKDIYSSVIKNRSNLETMSEHKDLMLADPKVENQKSYYGESKVHLNQKKRNHEKYIPDIKIQEIREFINKSNNLEVQSLNLTNTDISELIIISKNTIHRQLKADLINEYEHNDKSNIPLIIRKTTMIHQFNNYIVQYFENKTKKEGVKEEKSHRNFRRLSKVDNNPGKNVNENEHIIEIEKNHIEWISSIKDKIQDINFKSYHDDSDLIITINSLIISKINEKSSNDETLISWLEFNLDEKDITQLLFLEILKSIKERNLFCLFSEAMKDHYISFLFKYMLHIKLNTEDQSFIIGPDSIIDNQVVLLKLYRIYSKLHF
ncbi:hypothetical protein TRFO_34834 [Tritrichomonas foetus]|uniref:Uncharacterized protein n=1 Tax=Tritrichomonas foetus TaxID=1144522 RepID=A0A1J4JJZ7_9EUKA|nr:hypothetical protein TRFO_34834 [Tritrichomonas foetus]|eukprot:OHS98687.1 hypothetical protein TRFO_34834 [Tritrichomonas foetus]